MNPGSYINKWNVYFYTHMNLFTQLLIRSIKMLYVNTWSHCGQKRGVRECGGRDLCIRRLADSRQHRS